MSVHIGLKPALMTGLSIGIALNIISIVTGSVAFGIFFLILGIFGLFAVFTENPLFIKIFGGIAGLLLLIYDILGVISIFGSFNFVFVLIFLVYNFIYGMLLYYLYLFHNSLLGGRATAGGGLGSSGAFA